jgi:FkbM family methyltransferase
LIERYLKEKFRANVFMRKVKDFQYSLSQIKKNPYRSLSQILSTHSITQVIDVGANVGQFGADLRRHGYKGPILSIEPVSSLYSQLVKNSERYPPWIALNIGIGENSSEMMINVSSNNGLSSSFLTMLPLHLVASPNSGTYRKERIKVETLKDIFERFAFDPSSTLVKLDVQGYEYQALAGLKDLLPFVKCIFCEVSIEPLYSGEKTIDEIITFLRQNGHYVYDIFDGLRKETGSLLQVDLITINERP